MTESAADPGRGVQALREIAFGLERTQAPTCRVRAFRRAAEVVTNLPPGEAGCTSAIDTDAHAPGQLDWLDSGCARAEGAGVTADRVLNARHADEVAS